jgi:hypothetical protein
MYSKFLMRPFIFWKSRQNKYKKIRVKSRGLNGPFVVWAENVLCAVAFALLAAVVPKDPSGTIEMCQLHSATWARLVPRWDADRLEETELWPVDLPPFGLFCGLECFFFSNYTIHWRQSQRTHTHHYEYTHANPNSRSILKTVKQRKFLFVKWRSRGMV